MSPDEVVFTSDQHFGHEAILRYSNRPFASVDHMAEQLITRWNAMVHPSTTVYVIGDFFWRRQNADAILQRLKGRIFWVLGNHDNPTPLAKQRCVAIKDIAEVRVEDPDAPGGQRRIVLCHYPLLTWNGSHHGVWHLHGHSHGSLQENPGAFRVDVGVDCWDYRPVTYREIKAKMATKQFQPVDHHGRVAWPDVDAEPVV
jgi:calcineurin-like phosphoesterase family protein